MEVVTSVIRFLESFQLEEDLFSEYETDYISKRSYAHARRHAPPATAKPSRRHHTTTTTTTSRKAASETSSTRTTRPKEEIKKENKTLKKRVEELEDDLISASKTIERQRELRGRDDFEKGQISERNRALELALKTVREGYEEEIVYLRAEKEKREEEAKAAAVAAAEAKAAALVAEAAAKVRIKEKADKQMQAGPSSPRPQPQPQQPLPQPQSQPQSRLHTPPRPQVQLPPQPQFIKPRTPPSPKSPPRARCNHTDLLRQLRERDEEIKALREYMDKNDDLSTTEIVELVQGLNAEIRLLAATIADSVPFKRPWEVDRAWAIDVADPFLQRCVQLLAGGVDFSRDPTMVQIAVQTWLLRCCEVVFERFMFGLAEEEDSVLAKVYGSMLQDEQISVAARWRRLARIYARSADPDFDDSLTNAINRTTSQILRGLDSILSFAGHNLGNAPHLRGRPPPALASALFGEKVEDVVRSAVRVANTLAESVISAHYGLVSVEPGMRWNETVMESVEPMEEEDTMSTASMAGEGRGRNLVVCMMGFGMRCTKSVVPLEAQMTGESTLLGSPRFSKAGTPPRPTPPFAVQHSSMIVLKPEVLISSTMEMLRREGGGD